MMTKSHSNFTAELESAYQNYAKRRDQKNQLVQELEMKNIKFKQDEIIDIRKDKTNKIIFLERGNHNAGYKHILSHADSFKKIGVSIYRLPYVLFSALQENDPIAVQNSKHAYGGRPIYETHNGARQIQLAISTGSNGFIVGANPTHKK